MTVTDVERDMKERLIRIDEVLTLTSLSRSSVYAYMSRNEFPRPLRIGRRAVGWRFIHIKEWLDTRPATKPNFN
ncbi:helix-turn-helix transcriptional regulator [Sphingomonas faeni]|uniref:helix-turn-helix transcriptional regulator n=1 Tax=Sphingomonas faeni TaxID=185950 RepID=UPI003364C229